MNSPSEINSYGDWMVIYNDQNGTDDRLSEDKKVLARTLSIPNSMCILSETKTEISTVTELLSPKLKLPHLGNDTIERVFPVRSVVSFDSTPSSALQTPSLDKLESPISPFVDAFRAAGPVDEKTGALPTTVPASDTNPQTQSSKRPDHLSRMHQQREKLAGTFPSLSTVPTLSRFFSSKDQSLPSPYKPTSASRYDNPRDLNLSASLQKTILEGGKVLNTSKPTAGLQYSREDEASVAIQSFGTLLVLNEINGNLMAQVTSSNSREILGYTPDEIFETESICNILPESQRSVFLAHVRFVLDDEYDVEVSGPEVFDLSTSTGEGVVKHLWCTMHTSRTYKDYVICELEPEIANSPEVQTRDNTQEPEIQTNSVEICNSPDQKAQTMSSDLLNALPRIQQQVSNAQTLETLVQNTIWTFQQLTQFDRVTMYHFDGDRNGLVVADATDPALDLQSYEGIHFEESTFSDELKQQYLRNAFSFAYSRRSSVAELVYRVSTNKLGLDLSHCYLSAPPEPSEPHTDRPVQACISMGIHVFGKLWGLVSCQSYDENMRLHPLLQKVCWFMSEAVSCNIERLSYALPFQSQERNSPSEEAPTKKSVNSPSGDLVALFGANYAAASILGETKILGKPIDSQEVLALLEYFRAKELDTVLWYTDIGSDFEDLDYTPGFRHLSGLLYIPLSADGNDFIIFFRSETDPSQFDSLDQRDGMDKTPRQVEWSAAEFGKASILSLLYRTFTEIWQEKEAAMQNNQLMRLLLANSAHEFRTPLNAIINYLEIALDGSLNQETRENLSRSHSASKSLVYIINDLLDLTNAENGQRLIKDEVFSLSETLCEATDIFWEEARQKHVDLQVVQHSALPPVLGDQRRVRQVITNLISNAVQHTSSGAVTIESCILSELCEPEHIAVEVAIHDTGSGMSAETVETLFCELEQVSNKGLFQNPKGSGKGTSNSLETESVLGLGLALVARIVRNMDGQLSLKSEDGKGSCFKIRLKFSLPTEEARNQAAPQATFNEDLYSDCQGDSTQQPNGTPEEGQLSCQKQDSVDRPNETTAEERNSTPRRCGDGTFPGPGPGQQDGTFLDVDITLKTGDSRNISLPHHPKANSTSEPKPTSSPENAPSQSVESNPSPNESTAPTTQDPEPKMFRLHILVAEDDPINSTIVKRRLEKFGYTVRITGNGKECASVYRESPSSFDAVLMDLQMPIVDGLSATKMIREHELQSSNRIRIPVFAVSASLLEKDRQIYIDCGFDGWIMKPIDFQRVHELLEGVKRAGVRGNCLYQPGRWEQGGWFEACATSGSIEAPSSR